MFFLYMALSAALTWPIIMGWLEVVAAAAGFFIFFAKAPGVETARMARPIRMVFFTISSLNLERHTLVHTMVPQRGSVSNRPDADFQAVVAERREEDWSIHHWPD
jgi:hypothetical protein